MKRVVFRLGAGILMLAAVDCCRFPPGPTIPTPAQSAAIQDGLDEIAANNNVMTVLGTLYDGGILGVRFPTNIFCGIYENMLVHYFSLYGYTATLQEVAGVNPYYQSDPLIMNNIIAVLPGTEPSLGPVLVSAHWDAYPGSPGIDDNASGCVGVLEIARAVSARGLQFRRTIIFILFALEEENCAGSYFFVRQADRRPYAVFNMDMIGFTSAREGPVPLGGAIGFPEKGDFIGVFAPDFSSRIGMTFVYAASTFVPSLRYYFGLCDANMSGNPHLSLLLRGDQLPFWERGVPGLLITDTADLREGAVYHSENDTIDNIDTGFMLDVIKAVFAAVCIEADIIP
jgi:aminopeptidase YwaD